MVQPWPGLTEKSSKYCHRTRLGGGGQTELLLVYMLAWIILATFEEQAPVAHEVFPHEQKKLLWLLRHPWHQWERFHSLRLFNNAAFFCLSTGADLCICAAVCCSALLQSLQLFVLAVVSCVDYVVWNYWFTLWFKKKVNVCKPRLFWAPLTSHLPFFWLLCTVVGFHS